MARTPDRLADAELQFLTERHPATLTTLRADGSPHVVAIAFTHDPLGATVRIICDGRGQKVRNVERNGRAVVCQVDGRRWLSLEGRATVTRRPEAIAAAVQAFQWRYHPVRDNPCRVAIEITVERVLGRV